VQRLNFTWISGVNSSSAGSVGVGLGVAVIFGVAVGAAVWAGVAVVHGVGEGNDVMLVLMAKFQSSQLHFLDALLE
jgi:hypothetical protein